jgi:hypothetical protein
LRRGGENDLLRGDGHDWPRSIPQCRRGLGQSMIATSRLILRFSTRGRVLPVTGDFRRSDATNSKRENSA